MSDQSPVRATAYHREEICEQEIDSLFTVWAFGGEKNHQPGKEVRLSLQSIIHRLVRLLLLLVAAVVFPHEFMQKVIFIIRDALFNKSKTEDNEEWFFFFWERRH